MYNRRAPPVQYKKLNLFPEPRFPLSLSRGKGIRIIERGEDEGKFGRARFRKFFHLTLLHAEILLLTSRIVQLSVVQFSRLSRKRRAQLCENYYCGQQRHSLRRPLLASSTIGRPPICRRGRKRERERERERSHELPRGRDSHPSPGIGIRQRPASLHPCFSHEKRKDPFVSSFPSRPQFDSRAEGPHLFSPWPFWYTPYLSGYNPPSLSSIPFANLMSRTGERRGRGLLV